MTKGEMDGSYERNAISHQEEQEREPCAPQFHVLAVDDSLVDRKIIERLLKISAYKVTAVESAIRALEFLGLDEHENSLYNDRIKVNMIITDYTMPGMTGYELLRKIKESSALKEIPVVIVSSENVIPRIDRCLEEGAEEFIIKPVKLSDVNRLKGHIIRGLPNNDLRPASAKRKVALDNIRRRRPRLG